MIGSINEGKRFEEGKCVEERESGGVCGNNFAIYARHFVPPKNGLQWHSPWWHLMLCMFVRSSRRPHCSFLNHESVGVDTPPSHIYRRSVSALRCNLTLTG